MDSMRNLYGNIGRPLAGRYPPEPARVKPTLNGREVDQPDALEREVP